MPAASPATPGSTVTFLGPTAARRGAREMREAALRLDLEFAVTGASIEGSDFWQGTKARVRSGSPLEDCALLVSPAWVEDQQRIILRALAAGIPVLATTASGIPEQPGLTLIPPGDSDSLSDAISRMIDCRGSFS